MRGLVKFHGNHKIKFMNRNLDEIAIEIKNKLNKMKFANEEYLRFLIISDIDSVFDYDYHFVTDERIREYKEKTNWDWDFYFCEDSIVFDGIFDLSIQFLKSYIHFKHPRRYFFDEGFLTNKLIINEWRKYMYQIIKLTGGDRVIYLTGNTDIEDEKYYNEFIMEKKYFDEIEKSMIHEYGENNTIFENIVYEDTMKYYIDHFIGLNMNNEYSIKEYINILNRNKKKSLSTSLNKR
jgi:hypothetical protein